MYYVLSSDPGRSLFLESGIALWNTSAPSPIGLWHPCLESILLRSSAPLPVASITSIPASELPRGSPLQSLYNLPDQPVCLQAYSRCGLPVLFRLIYILDIVYISTYGPALFCCLFVLNCYVQESFLKHAMKPRSYKRKVDRFDYIKIKSFSMRKDTKNKDDTASAFIWASNIARWSSFVLSFLSQQWLLQTFLPLKAPTPSFLACLFSASHRKPKSPGTNALFFLPQNL